MAEKKRPKAESFFHTKALDVSGSDDEMARPKKADEAIKVLRVMASSCRPRRPQCVPCPHCACQNWGGTGFQGTGQALARQGIEYLVFSGGSVCVL